jgi:acyl-coenzyme A thioesterase PaaI-like protein
MDPRTHLGISTRLCGRALSLSPGKASIELVTLPEMAVDPSGLVHGSFPFGAADHAAMLAVNEPSVVLGSAQLKFLKPVVAGETLVADAIVTRSEGKKRFVSVRVTRGGDLVLEAEVLALVPDRHVLQGPR